MTPIKYDFDNFKLDEFYLAYSDKVGNNKNISRKGYTLFRVTTDAKGFVRLAWLMRTAGKEKMVTFNYLSAEWEYFQLSKEEADKHYIMELL